jgi:hypothetical protein
MTQPIDPQHAESLALLQQVAEYLDRLPLVPTTRELSRRIKEHLENPDNVVTRRAYETAGLEFTGGSYTVAGFPLIEAHVVVPASVYIRSAIPEEPRFQDEHEKQLLNLLYGDGIVLALSPVE